MATRAPRLAVPLRAPLAVAAGDIRSGYGCQRVAAGLDRVVRACRDHDVAALGVGELEQLAVALRATSGGDR